MSLVPGVGALTDSVNDAARRMAPAMSIAPATSAIHLFFIA
jgi:hypothetical protein